MLYSVAQWNSVPLDPVHLVLDPVSLTILRDSRYSGFQLPLFEITSSRNETLTCCKLAIT